MMIRREWQHLARKSPAATSAIPNKAGPALRLGSITLPVWRLVLAGSAHHLYDGGETRSKISIAERS